MTQAPGPHLSPDDVENWLSGTLDAERTRHLDLCPECFDRAQVEREIVELLSALPVVAPSAGFADRVMASVTIADPFALRSLGTLRQRIFATRRSIAIAAILALIVVGSMAASRPSKPSTFRTRAMAAEPVRFSNASKESWALNPASRSVRRMSAKSFVSGFNSARLMPRRSNTACAFFVGAINDPRTWRSAVPCVLARMPLSASVPRAALVCSTESPAAAAASAAKL